jgi:CDP-4-dehydro-6-deoxyglucose reductase
MMDLFMDKASTGHSVTTQACGVLQVKPLNEGTFEIELMWPADIALVYQAGQYLQLELDVNNDGQEHSLSYSIANRFDARQPCRLQLFIQNSSEFSAKVIDRLYQLSEDKQKVSVTLAMGRAYLQSDLDLTHILIAAGSGISKIKCLAEEILKQRRDAHVNIYWSNRGVNNFYLLHEFEAWAVQNKNLSFSAILESADTDWQGRWGYIYEVIEKDFNNLDGVQAYLCGSPHMVYGTIDKLKSRGLKEEDCYSDVFEYAPRDHKVAI